MLVGLLALVPALPASATSTSNSNPNNYLALGDSVPFGYNPLLVKPGVSPSVFVGYPELVSNLFRPQLKVVNASCPGETSASLITGTRPDYGCQDYRQSIGALHVSYQGSQLKFAEHYLAANRQTKFVSLMIGANDLDLLQDSCAGAVNANACLQAGLPGALATVQANLVTIYSGLRAAGYKGEFVAVTYYSTDYTDPVVTGAAQALDGVLSAVTRSYGGKVANGFAAFAAVAAFHGGDSCAAGLLIHLTSTTCDEHPSRAGADLLALALYAAVGPEWPNTGPRT
jgi:lysophospholipase L1-like esterase